MYLDIYATDILYSGQRASLGKIVICRYGGLLTPGIISGFVRRADGEIDIEVTVIRGGGVALPLASFRESPTPESLADLPPGRWSWPPRV